MYFGCDGKLESSLFRDLILIFDNHPGPAYTCLGDSEKKILNKFVCPSRVILKLQWMDTKPTTTPGENFHVTMTSVSTGA